jgi:hypothetical protein
MQAFSVGKNDVWMACYVQVVLTVLLMVSLAPAASRLCSIRFQAMCTGLICAGALDCSFPFSPVNLARMGASLLV